MSNFVAIESLYFQGFNTGKFSITQPGDLAQAPNRTPNAHRRQRVIFRDTPYCAPTDHQYALIGRAVAEWTIIEHLINALLGRLVGVSTFPMRAITERLTGPGREEALSLLAEIHSVRYQHRILDEDGVAALKRIDRRFRALKRVRNDVAHLIWIRSSDDEMFATGLTAQLPEVMPSRWKQGAVVTNIEIEHWIARVAAFGDEIEQLLAVLPERDENSWLNASALPN
jgi:hypothetical protein